MKIKSFMLERYFAKYEFSAPYLLSCSDAEPLTLKELLSMGDRETRALWENLLFGLSKSFSLPGLRVGWLISRDLKLIEDIISYKDYTTIRGSAPSEVLAIIALRARETILARNRAIISHNLQILDKFFREHDLFSPGINHATEQLVFRNYCWISL